MANDPDYANIDPRSEVNPTGKPFVRLERHGQVAELVLDRPEKLNAWAWGPTNELCALADELRFDTSVRVVILRGEGRAFCAGEDLKPDTHGVKDRHFGRSPAEVVRNSYERARYCFERWAVLEQLPQPLLVAVHGYCLGAGCRAGHARRHPASGRRRDLRAAPGDDRGRVSWAAPTCASPPSAERARPSCSP